MQTIIKTNPASNFTPIANDLLTSTMPGNAQKILLYLLSKPSNWRLKTHDLRKQLGLSGYAVKKGLRWLGVINRTGQITPSFFKPIYRYSAAI